MASSSIDRLRIIEEIKRQPSRYCQVSPLEQSSLEKIIRHILTTLIYNDENDVYVTTCDEVCVRCSERIILWPEEYDALKLFLARVSGNIH